ncbi:MAG: hypothetical protein BV457_00690 [Thermoplasmata archaeon M9B1D]|nr:MAG: hypothetical protein BV457_00690 [Thermoplasmata archaeon M9B1D]PNX52043.1 MAG: hypothetical protein BV456_00805 [Thermoplasmata archaeon M8B2D]
MAIYFDIKEDENKNIMFLTSATGNDIIRAPLLNKGTAFNEDERERFGLDGLLPPRVLTLEQQVEKVYQRYNTLGNPSKICINCDKIGKLEQNSIKKEGDLARFNFLRDLHDRNEILFYAFCHSYLEEVIPIIYTPTVGDAVIRYSRDSARFRGIFISPKNIESVEKIFNHFRFKHPTIAVVTDNQGILGLGDQGVGGIDIPIGKLALYVLGAGIRPWETMPLTLDVGTDNSADLLDSYYLGYKKGRLRGIEYEEFIDKFVDGIRKKFPDILIQWEDFSRQNAFTILDKYRYKILSFNDDIQGTGSVALAGIINALKLSKEEIVDQKFVIYGAGAGGIGIARRIAACLVLKYHISKEKANDKIAVIDSKGLVTDQNELEDYKKPFMKKKNVYKNWNVENISNITLLEVVKNFKPTVLIGTSGRPGHFTKEILTEMNNNSSRPIVFPLSNPTSNSEATPQDIYKVTKGKAIVATGSPFESFKHAGNNIIIGQCNNFFIFPGVGLGAIISKGKYIPDAVFTEVAYKLAEMTPNKRISKGAVYPSINEIRNISANIAFTTITEIAKERGTSKHSLEDIKSKMWTPRYYPMIKI